MKHAYEVTVIFTDKTYIEEKYNSYKKAEARVNQLKADTTKPVRSTRIFQKWFDKNPLTTKGFFVIIKTRKEKGEQNNERGRPNSCTQTH